MDFIDTNTQAEIIKILTKILKTYYVYPDIAEQICNQLQKHLEDGDYSEITESEFFAYALTMHMQNVCGDEHLWVRWHPEPLSEHEGPLRQNQAWMVEQRLEAQLDNFGIHKLERLPGNVGYIDIHKFHKVEWAGDTVVASMNFLANMSALIIDLRNCQGGYPDMVSLVSSYLFGEEPMHLGSIYWREENHVQQYWTLPYVPGQRFGDKPVFALISKGTFSGGEAFAHHLKSHQRATLVGERTDGGAHPSASHRLHAHFEVFIPVGRAINPTTGENWENSGVIPDISVPQEQALHVAHRMALESILESIHEPVTGAYSRLMEEVQSALKDLKAT